jgi:hypothetical protein
MAYPFGAWMSHRAHPGKGNLLGAGALFSAALTGAARDAVLMGPGRGMPFLLSPDKEWGRGGGFQGGYGARCRLYSVSTLRIATFPCERRDICAM